MSRISTVVSDTAGHICRSALPASTVPPLPFGQRTGAPLVLGPPPALRAEVARTLLQGSVCVVGSPSDVGGVRLERSSELFLRSASQLVVAASRHVSSDRACGSQAFELCWQSWVERVRLLSFCLCLRPDPLQARFVLSFCTVPLLTNPG